MTTSCPNLAGTAGHRFAMGLKRLLMALDSREIGRSPPVDTLVAFDNENRRQGYQIAQKLREEGRRVELLSEPVRC